MFVLQPDGHWLDFNAYACQGESEAIDEIVFPSMTKVMETFSTLFGPESSNVRSTRRDYKLGLNVIAPIHYKPRVWVEQYKMRHRKDRGG
jgi:hypothetical protein